MQAPPPNLRPGTLRNVAALLVLASLAYPAGTCGPSFPEAIFVRHTAPAVAYTRYVAGSLGVLQPTYPIRQLVIAYNILSGRPLSSSEQAEAVQLQKSIVVRDFNDTPSTTDGLAQWVTLRETIALPGSGIAKPYPNAPTPPTIDTERQIPGQDYESFANCLDDAFHTAALTLEARQQAHGANAPEVLDWVQAQDAVFSNCAGPRRQIFGPPPPPVPASLAPDRTPAPAPASASPWLKEDRAYQLAAAHFYRTDYDIATADFRAIAADPASPWQKSANYLVARSILRRATIGQISDIPPAPPGAPNPNGNYEAQSKRQAGLAQQLPERFREARHILESILNDPSLAPWHHAAGSFLDAIAARLDPAHQATVLAARLTSTTPPANSTFSQNLIDLAYVIEREHSAPKPTSPSTPSSTDPSGPGADLLRWISTMQSVAPADPDLSQTPAPAPHITQALNAWHRTHTDPWLVAALTLAQPDTPGLPALLEAARQTPPSSPAFLSVTYHRLRLTPASASTRSEIASLLPTLEHSGDLSAINLFEQLQSASSPTLQAFLAQAARVPATVTIDGVEEDSPATNRVGQPCGPELTDATTPLFANDTATVLNQRLPLRLLAQAAHSTTLPSNLRFQIVQSAWTRALLLEKPDIARSLAPILIACHDSWRPVLDAYAAAQTPEALHIASLLALMRFASTEPLVRNGEQRPEGFATYSDYRDNWWCGNQPALGPDGKPLPPNDPHQRDLLFNQLVLPSADIPDPPFLTPADQSEAATEITQLKKIPGAPDYFAQQTLNIFRAHPDNPHNSDLLGQAERVVRNGCRSDNTKELNHQLFTAVQTHYPNSEWARKYTTWD